MKLGAFLQSPLFWNLITLAVIAAFAGAIWRARQQPLWVEAYQRLRRRRLATVALAVMAVYVTIGVLDSISWQDNRNAPSRSVIDRVFDRPKERTYSAPFAR